MCMCMLVVLLQVKFGKEMYAAAGKVGERKCWGMVIWKFSTDHALVNELEL